MQEYTHNIYIYLTDRQDILATTNGLLCARQGEHVALLISISFCLQYNIILGWYDMYCPQDDYNKWNMDKQMSNMS